MNDYGKLFRISRFLVRRFYPRYTFDHPERLQNTGVFLCRHFNTSGIFRTVPWLTDPVRIWALSVYFDRKVCYDHLTQYTLTQRFGWSAWRARLVARPVSAFLSALMRSARAIPVYRESMRVLTTMRLSLQALEEGKSLLIFPDRDYTHEGGGVDDIYEGFLMLDVLYARKHKTHLPFITLYANEQDRVIHVSQPVYFEQTGDAQEREQVKARLMAQLSGRSCPSKDRDGRS